MTLQQSNTAAATVAVSVTISQDDDEAANIRFVLLVSPCYYAVTIKLLFLVEQPFMLLLFINMSTDFKRKGHTSPIKHQPS